MEYKFRGQKLSNGTWIYGDLIHSVDEIIEIGVAFDDQYGKRYMRFKVDPKTIGQYSNLPDRNRKEIYDGDILKAINAYKDWVMAVSFDRGIFLGKTNPLHKGTALYQWDLSCYEIIGNIHDNPKLFNFQTSL